MSAIKHTPGPWAVEDPLGADVGFWIVQDGLQAFEWACIAMVTGDDEETRSGHSRFITADEQETNARLIAAAPELLAMLKHAVHWHDQLTPADIARYEAVVAKATPREGSDNQMEVAAE